MQKQPNTMEHYAVKLEDYPLDDNFPLHSFRYRPGPVIHSLHFHPFMEIAYCMEGSGIFVIDEQVIPFEAGKILLIFPNQLHKAQSVGSGSTWDFIYSQPQKLLREMELSSFLSLSKLFDPNSRYDNLKPCDPGIRTAVKTILEELRLNASNQQACIRALFWYLCLKLQRELTDGGGTDAKSKRAQKLLRLAPALDYISKNFADDFSVSELAAQCYMSLTTLRREFSESLQMSPLEYITMMRIKTAAFLIRDSNRSICAISGEVGFQTLSSFNRHFKKIMGCSPTQYRGMV